MEKSPSSPIPPAPPSAYSNGKVRNREDEMTTIIRPCRLIAVLVLAFGAFSACQTSDSGSASMGVYYGSGFYDPWYYGGYYDSPDLIVPPPNRPDNPSPPPRPAHPIV